MEDVIVTIFDGGEVIASEPFSSPITAAQAQKGIRHIKSTWPAAAGSKRPLEVDEAAAKRQHGIYQGDADMAAFWQHLHLAQLERQHVSLQLEQDEEPLKEQFWTLSLAGNTCFLGHLDSMPSILVPEDYQQLWQEVQPLVEQWLSIPANERRPVGLLPVRFVYTGTPGIGKSFAGFYLMYKLRSKYGAKIDFVYQHELTGMQYLFRGDCEVLQRNTARNSFDEILARRTTIYMVDGKGVQELPRLVTLFAFCSPDTSNWKEVLKARSVRLRYLPEVFASQWVAEEVVRSAGQQAEHKIHEFVAAHDKDPRAAGMCSQVFEALAHKVLQRGGTFRVRPLGTNSQPAGLKQLCGTMRTVQRLIFVVPDAIFDMMTEQPLVMSGNKDMRPDDVHISVRGVKQFVLALPTTSGAVI
ncbi:g3365 [Coccomyxa elongata]